MIKQLDSVCNSLAQAMLEKTGIKWYVGYRRHSADFIFWFISRTDRLETCSLTRGRIKDCYGDWDRFIAIKSDLMSGFFQARKACMESDPGEWQPFLAYVEKLFNLAKVGKYDLMSDEVIEIGRIFRIESEQESG